MNKIDFFKSLVYYYCLANVAFLAISVLLLDKNSGDSVNYFFAEYSAVNSIMISGLVVLYKEIVSFVTKSVNVLILFVLIYFIIVSFMVTYHDELGYITLYLISLVILSFTATYIARYKIKKAN